jgi:hypothetical protein
MTERRNFEGWWMRLAGTYTDRDDANVKAVQLRKKKFLVRVVPYGGRWKVFCTMHVVTIQQRRK